MIYRIGSLINQPDNILLYDHEKFIKNFTGHCEPKLRQFLYFKTKSLFYKMYHRYQTVFITKKKQHIKGTYDRPTLYALYYTLAH